MKMMTTLILLCLSLLDVRHPPVPNDGIERKFVATQLVEQSLVDCTENTQGGGFNGDPHTVDWTTAPEPTEQGGVSTWFPEDVSATENVVVQPMSMRVMSDDPPKPPVVVTPEPPVAILFMTGLALLFLLFGRRLRCRFS